MKKEIDYKDYCIQIEDNNSVKLISSNTSITPVKPILREIAKEVNFQFNEDWNTQTLGSKLVDYLQCPKNMGTSIVINRMYVGDYLSSNLGHEVINMYTADNGKHYLYLNAYGSFAKKWQSEIGYMLLTKYHCKGCVEVIGKAIGLSDVYSLKDSSNKNKEDISEHQVDYIRKEEINYGEVSLLKLFSDAERQSVYVTFVAEKVFKVANDKKIFIHYANQINENIEKQDNTIDIYLEDNKLALASLDQFFQKDEKDYCKLYNLIINHNDFWKELGNDDKIKIEKKKVNAKPRKESIFDICQIQNNENCFSNALAYFMKEYCYKKLWSTFFESILGVKLDDYYCVKREEHAKITDDNYKSDKSVEGGGRIDLVIRDSNNIIIIENKIKSDINKKSSDDNDTNQLHRYKEYVEWRTSGKEIARKGNEHYYILAPNYNKPTIPPELEADYKIITYSDLYDFLGNNRSIWENDPNFVAFYEAMKRHTHENVNDYLYYEMQDKLMRRIYECHQNK